MRWVNRFAAGEAARFLLATGVSACITVGLPILLHEGFDLREEAAVAVAFVFAFFFNFFVVKYYVFNSTGKAGGELIRFAIMAAIFRVLEYLAFLLMFTVLNLNYIFSLLSVLIISTLGKYLFSRHVVFARRT